MQIANLCLSFVSRCIVCICWFRRFELSAFVYLRILALARPHKDGSRPEPAPHTLTTLFVVCHSRAPHQDYFFFQLCCIVKLVEYIKKPFCHVGRLVNDLTQFFSLRPFHLVARGKIWMICSIDQHYLRMGSKASSFWETRYRTSDTARVVQELEDVPFHSFHTGTLAHWHTGTLAHWHTGTLALALALALAQYLN